MFGLRFAIGRIAPGDREFTSRCSDCRLDCGYGVYMVDLPGSMQPPLNGGRNMVGRRGTGLRGHHQIQLTIFPDATRLLIAACPTLHLSATSRLFDVVAVDQVLIAQVQPTARYHRVSPDSPF